MKHIIDNISLSWLSASFALYFIVRDMEVHVEATGSEIG